MTPPTYEDEPSTSVATPRRRWLGERTLDSATRILDAQEMAAEEAYVSPLPKLEPMVQYQQKPIEFCVEKLGIPENTIRWSMNPGYDTHDYDGTREPLVAMLEALRDWKDVCVEAGTGTQKAQPIDTPVLTPAGWRAIGSLRVGDRVVGSNGKSTPVIALYPQGEQSVYRVNFSDGASTRATGEHRWRVTPGAGPTRILSTADLRTAKLSRHWRVPLPLAVELPECDLPVDPYVIGVLLGDGSYCKATPRVATADLEILSAISAATGLTARHAGWYSYDFSDRSAPRNSPNPLMVELRELGMAGQRATGKTIPSQYLWASANQRLALLQGLLDTDGTVRRGIVCFDSTSKGLADGVVHLARSLGGTAVVRKGPTSLYGKRYSDSYRVHLHLPRMCAAFRLERKLEKVRHRRTAGRIVRSVVADGRAECVCIQVAAADGLYVTENFIVTHNSYTAAAATLWFLASFYEARVFSFAPKESQLRAYIWMEIGKLWPRFQILFPSAILTDLQIKMRGDKDHAWGAQGYAVGMRAGEEISTKAKGMHARDLLLIYEEAPGIPLPVVEAGENTSTAPHNLRMALGNPEHQLDTLHLFGFNEFGIVRPGVVPVRISALDHPNVVSNDPDIVPGAVSEKSITRRRFKYGVEGRFYKSQVRGLSPAEAAEALIKLEWVQRAQKRWEDKQTQAILEAVGKGKESLGVDVADSEDGDEAAISRWKGAYCREVPSFPCPNSNNLGYQVFLEMRERGILADHVGVDGVGVGAGTVNELRNRGEYIRSLKGGSDGTIDEEEWNTLRSQIWWTLAEDLRFDRIAIPPDVELSRDLITPKWEPKNGKIVVESKLDIKARTPSGRSPNKGDALAYGNYVRPRDPVVSELAKNRPLTVRERLMKEFAAMDEPTIQKHYGHILRQ